MYFRKVYLKEFVRRNCCSHSLFKHKHSSSRCSRFLSEENHDKSFFYFKRHPFPAPPRDLFLTRLLLLISRTPLFKPSLRRATESYQQVASWLFLRNRFSPPLHRLRFPLLSFLHRPIYPSSPLLYKQPLQTST